MLRRRLLPSLKCSTRAAMRFATINCMLANHSAAHIAYACSDAAFIYPITPSSEMSEICDDWSTQGRKNIFGQQLLVTEMQSEGGSSGAVHGALLAGGLATSFTCSQGLLLMIPNMFKIAGELLPAVVHVAARTVATHAVSMYGDHSDVIALRPTGWTMLCSDSCQAAHDIALVSHCGALDSRIPVVHFFDGFRTSHEMNSVELLGNDQIAKIFPFEAAAEHRARGLSPLHPQLRGTCQGTEVWFQGAERLNPFQRAVPGKIDEWFKKVGDLTGRNYKAFDYTGHKDAEDVIVIMGSAGHTVDLCVNAQPNRKIGVVKVRLYRPWSAERFLASLPKTVKRITVLDRVKDCTAQAGPMATDVMTTILHAGMSNVKVFWGRYALSGKDFTPSHADSVFANMHDKSPKTDFTVNIIDDMTHTNLPIDHKPDFDWRLDPTMKQCIFYGLASDGTVGANKMSVKIIQHYTGKHAQAYFEFDAKKSGGTTISHLRCGEKKIDAPFLIHDADFIACHKTNFIFRYDILKNLNDNGIVLLNATEELAKRLPAKMKRTLAKKKAQLYILNANAVCAEVGLGKRINTVMQAAFFYLTNIMPYDKAVEGMKAEIDAQYSKKEQKVREQNYEAVEKSIGRLIKIEVPPEWANAEDEPVPAAPPAAESCKDKPCYSQCKIARDDFVKRIMEPMVALEGDSLPVSTFEPGSPAPLGTSEVEKRGIALEIPTVDMDKCTQCNYCSFVCPHAAIRPFLLTPQEVADAPATVKKTAKAAIGGGELDNFKYRVQVSPLDCTGCQLCTKVCPSDALKMVELDSAVEDEAKNWNYVSSLPIHGEGLDKASVKGSQWQKPLLEFSGACEGCGETPYVKLLSQLCGDRAVIANGTGCSIVWASWMPSYPYTWNKKGHGPAWANSLFEDNAEFGLGMLKTRMQRTDWLLKETEALLKDSSCKISSTLRGLLSKFVENHRQNKPDILLGRGRSAFQDLAEKIVPLMEEEKKQAPQLEKLWPERENFYRVSQWLIGGDGWAYDIGFAGLDHVLQQGLPIKCMILDTQVYSNTGGQASKATPTGASVKFQAFGKSARGKDMGQYIMGLKDVYVANVNLNANMSQCVQAMLEAEAYPGTAVIIAYCPCIASGYPMSESIQHCKEMVASGYWPLYRFNPSLREIGENPLQLDSKRITGDLQALLEKENRFSLLMRKDPERAKMLFKQLKNSCDSRMADLQLQAARREGQTADAKGEGAEVKILYGSETGNAAEQAKSLAADLSARGMKPELVCALDDYNFKDLVNEKFVIFVVSTCGLGEFPQNCRQFWKTLSDPNLDLGLLKNLKYCMFGLGDSTYCAFCSSAIAIDKRLAELGATRILPRGVGDDRDEERYFTGWGEWLPTLYDSLKLNPLPLKREIPRPAYTVDITPASGEKPLVPNEKLVQHGGVAAQLLVNKLLTPPTYDRDIRHYEVELTPGSPLQYSIGDSLAIFPQNDPKKVREFCSFYGLNPTDELNICMKPEARNKLPTEMNVEQLFTVYLDIFGRPTKRFYEALLNFSKDEKETKELEGLALSTPEGKQLAKDFIAKHATYFDILRRFPGAKPSLDQLMNMIPLIRSRSYSISSSPLVHKDKIHLSIVQVDGGLCTAFLRHLTAPTQVVAAIRKSSIVLPEDPSKPVVMVGTGTGVAPWRAVTQHRMLMQKEGANVGMSVLFYGARYSKQEFLYEDELKGYESSGKFKLITAFSRDQKNKIYVQHRIEEHGALLYDILVKQGGHIYVCGTSRDVPEDIQRAVAKAFMKAGEMDAKEADALIASLKNVGRYVVEAWA